MEIFNYYYELPSAFPALNVTGIYFILFVLFTSFLLFFNNKTIRNIVLFFVSCFFIWTFSQDGYFLIISLLICVYGYSFSFALNKIKNKFLYVISILIPVFVLIIFKNTSLFNGGFIVPLGISFYILRLIWYFNQIYHGVLEFDLNPLYLFNYLIFFPCFSAGPIEKPDFFINQLNKNGDFSFNNIKEGWFRFLSGIFEKIVICDFIGTVVDRILPVSEVTGVTVLVGIILYSFQIYLDFDSYSNIALGAAKIFGIELNENFKTPYLSVNIKEFWSRWHISLSTWLKENIYIPLGGNKKGKVRKIINICLVFIVSGIWHGSTFNFIIWGLLHAGLRVLEDYLEEKLIKYVNLNSFVFKVIRIIVNFCLVTLFWVMFKYDNIIDIFMIFGRLFTGGQVLFSGIEITSNEVTWLCILLTFVIIVDILRYNIRIFYYLPKAIFPIRYAIYLIGIVIILIFGVYGGNFDSADFIYRWF